MSTIIQDIERRQLREVPQFKAGDSAASLGLTGRETYDLTGIAGGIKQGQDVAVRAVAGDGSEKTFTVRLRIDTLAEIKYYQNGGILPAVLRDMMRA